MIEKRAVCDGCGFASEFSISELPHWATTWMERPKTGGFERSALYCDQCWKAMYAALEERKRR